MTKETDETREELRTIRQLLSQLLDLVAERVALDTSVGLTENGLAAVAASGEADEIVRMQGITPDPKAVLEETEAARAAEVVGTQAKAAAGLAHTHGVAVVTETEPLLPVAEPQPQPEPEPEPPKDLPGVRSALAAIVGGPTFTAAQKDWLKGFFRDHGVAMLKDLGKEFYGELLARFRKEAANG